MSEGVILITCCSSSTGRAAAQHLAQRGQIVNATARAQINAHQFAYD